MPKFKTSVTPEVKCVIYKKKFTVRQFLSLTGNVKKKNAVNR